MSKIKLSEKLNQTNSARANDNLHNFILTFLLATRFISEIITNFVWKNANYVWSATCLIFIGLWWWRFLIPDIRKERSIFKRYLPIFFYLSFLFVRIDFFNFYSIKCFFSEFIVWILFVYASAIENKNPNTIHPAKNCIIVFIKIILIISIIQLIASSIINQTVNPFTLFNERPVKGIFTHQNIFLVVVLPFFFYFLKTRQFFWVPVLLISCFFTGTRAPFLALVCMAPLALKSVLKRTIRWRDVFVSMAIIIIVYMGLIIKSPEIEFRPNNGIERFGMASFQWRVEFWKEFAQVHYNYSTIFGHGVGTSDKLAGDLVNLPLFYPHNDFLRIYYDTGILGLLIFLNIIIFVLKLIKNSISTDSDFILLAYMMIICFYLTDNFIYFTHAIFVYSFIAIYLLNSKMSN